MGSGVSAQFHLKKHGLPTPSGFALGLKMELEVPAAVVHFHQLAIFRQHFGNIVLDLHNVITSIIGCKMWGLQPDALGQACDQACLYKHIRVTVFFSVNLCHWE